MYISGFDEKLLWEDAQTSQNLIIEWGWVLGSLSTTETEKLNFVLYTNYSFSINEPFEYFQNTNFTNLFLLSSFLEKLSIPVYLVIKKDLHTNSYTFSGWRNDFHCFVRFEKILHPEKVHNTRYFQNYYSKWKRNYCSQFHKIHFQPVSCSPNLRYLIHPHISLSSSFDNDVTMSLFVSVETYNGSSLFFWRLDRKQMGAYLCIASNDVPPAVSKRIALNVNCEYKKNRQSFLSIDASICAARSGVLDFGY